MRALLPLLLAACAAAPAPAPRPAGEETITGGDLLRDIGALASPEMAGRGVGTPGIDQAAAYVERAMREAGLEPGGAGGYLQEFQVPAGVRLGGDNHLSGAAALEAGSDWLPFGFSEDGATIAPVVFAGFGITAPELGWDDYSGLEVRGKVALVLSHEPREHDQTSPFRAPAAFRYRENRYKAMNARDHGAVAVLIAPDVSAHLGEPDRLTALRGASGAAGAGILAVQLGIRGAVRLWDGFFDLEREMAAATQPRSREIPATASLAVTLVKDRQPARNVIGILPGADPALAGEALVIGAHYDHLGLGGENSLAPDQTGTPHLGADDNASGTAALLALARAFHSDAAPRRTVVFAAFSAEEMGLLGSAAFVKHPPVPVASMVAMVNMDMVGRPVAGRVHVHGADTATELREIVSRANEGLGNTVAFSGDGFGPSDHTSFWALHVPVLFFFTGAHTDYHRPTDSADKINGPGAELVARLVYRVARALADGKRVTPAPAVAPPMAHAGGHGDAGGGGYGPYLGTIPDFAERSEPGVLLSGVRAGSPAEKAGILAGDVIVRFAGTEIRNLYDLTYALRARRPGDSVEVEVLRGGKRITATPTLGVRP